MPNFKFNLMPVRARPRDWRLLPRRVRLVAFDSNPKAAARHWHRHRMHDGRDGHTERDVSIVLPSTAPIHRASLACSAASGLWCDQPDTQLAAALNLAGLPLDHELC